MFKRYYRAQKWLQEQNPDNQRKTEETSDDGLPSMEELRREALQEQNKLEKGDIFAMIVAAFFTILLPCALFLLFIVGVGMLIF